MNSSSVSHVRNRRFAATVVFVCGLSSSLIAAAENGLLITGYNVQYGGVEAAISDSALSREQLCGSDGEALMLNLMNQIGDRIGERLSGGGFSADERKVEAQLVIDVMCQRNESFSLDAHAMTHSECRMINDSASVMSDVSMPPGNAPVVMTISDFYRAESSRMTFDPTMAAAGSLGATMSDLNWTGPGDNKQIAGYSATRWNFDYETGLGGGSMAGLAALGIDASINTVGYGYFSTSVPGMDTVQAFFNNFAIRFKEDQGSSSMFAGTLKTMVQMLQKGIPLEMDTTVSSNMRGAGAMNMRTTIQATGVRTITLADDICSRDLVPDYFTVNDMNEQMQGLGGADAQGMSDLNQSMGELNKMMEDMTPEQREAISGMGLESLIPGMGAQPNAAPAGAPPAAAATRSGLSSQLTTDNMVQSVQLHLQALGIDPGNTSGDLDLNTQIAISQFQAQKGMKPTGEVTPQLLGILSAEVDSGN